MAAQNGRVQWAPYLSWNPIVELSGGLLKIIFFCLFDNFLMSHICMLRLLLSKTERGSWLVLACEFYGIVFHEFRPHLPQRLRPTWRARLQNPHRMVPWGSRKWRQRTTTSTAMHILVYTRYGSNSVCCYFQWSLENVLHYSAFRHVRNPHSYIVLYS